MIEVPEGIKVKFEHRRWAEEAQGKRWLVTRREVPEAAVVVPCGGRTIARLFDQDGNLYAAGVALCRENENYDHRLGNRIALARALAHKEGRLHPGPRVAEALNEAWMS